MCSRFGLSLSPREAMARFGLPEPPVLPNRDEVRPTDAALAIGGAGAALLRWGLPVAWDAKPLINARAETLASRPTFRRLLGNRVLVPASGWWEWRVEGSRRIKTWIAPAGGGVFAFAGLAEDGRFAIVTRAAAADLAAIHSRMPAILPRGLEAAWADPNTAFADLAAGLDAETGGFTTVAEESPPPAQGRLF